MHHFVKIKDKHFFKANLQLKLQYQDMSHAMVATIKIYIHVPEGMDNYIPMIQNTHSIWALLQLDGEDVINSDYPLINTLDSDVIKRFYGELYIYFPEA